MLEKKGWDSTDYDGQKVSWVITVNKAKHHIQNAVIKDTIGAGLKLMVDSIEVYDSQGERVDLKEGQPEITAEGFKLKLGDITDSYTIKYDTEITDHLPEGETEYKNNVSLDGSDGLVGVGEDDITKNPGVEPSVDNIYKKDIVNNVTVDSIEYDGLNYENKTMSWKLTVDAIKEKITKLMITDTFEPEKSMKFLEETLRVVRVSKIGNEETRILVESEEYELTDNGVDGFKLEFKESLARTKYEVYFKTSFDPDVVIQAGGEPIIRGGLLTDDQEYKNNVNYKGKTIDIKGNEKDLDIDWSASYPVDKDYANGGKKSGILDREKRTINWEIYANTSGQNLTGGPFIITDTLIGDKQVLNKDVKVRTYSLDKVGTIKPGDEITEGFTIDYDSTEADFILTFKNGVEVPILVEFSSKIIGQSNEWYKNKAVVSDITDTDKTYPGEVKYEKHDQFVTKEAMNANGNTVYTDDEIDWEVVLNESLSEIKNAVFKDTMSSGLVLIHDSIKISNSKGEPVNLPEDAIDIKINPETKETELSITLGDISEERYTITYKTVVTATTGNVSNEASLTGNDENLGSSGDKEYEAMLASWGTGTGREDRGQIEIAKIDAETKEEIMLPAKFELYYYLNGDDKHIVTGESQVTKDGKIQYGNLPFRTYYLREVEAPTGYVLSDTIIEIVLDDKENKEINLSVENKKKTYAVGDYTWIDTNRDGIQDENEPVLPGVTVELSDEQGAKIGTTTTDEKGRYIFDELPKGEYKIQFTLTDEQLKTYRFTKQNTQEEGSDIDSDADSKTGWTIKFKLDDDNQQLISNENYPYGDVIASEGIDPTWDAGVIVRTYAIGDYTWIDTNKDGIQDETEEVLVGVIVTLHDKDGKEIGRTETDKNGLYIFDNLEAGDYKVKFNLTETQKKLYEFTKQNAREDRQVDSDAHPITGWTTTITLNQENEFLSTEYVKQEFEASEGIDPTWDAGVVLRKKIAVTGTKIWIGGPEKKPTIELQLYRNEEPLGQPVELKDGETNYTWRNLYETDTNKRPYIYTIKEVGTPSEYNKSEEGLTVTNTRKTYAIGDYTWIDTNKDGIQDADEPILSGVIVELYDAKDKKIGETTTDANGRYLFDELESGEYQVKFTLTKEQEKRYTFTRQNTQKDGSSIDSDANPETGWTIKFKLDENNQQLTSNEDYPHGDVKASEGIDPTWDAGVIEIVTEITGQKLWIDDNDEAGLRPAFITVNLLQNGEQLTSMKVTPDAKGEWHFTFEDLPKVDETGKEYVYTVMEVEEPDYFSSVEGTTITNILKEGPIKDLEPEEPFDPEGEVKDAEDEGNPEVDEDKPKPSGKLPETGGKQPPKTGGNKPGVNQGKRLPQTGEKANSIAMILGISLTAVVVGIWISSRRKEEV